MAAKASLRSLLELKKPVAAPGAYDALSAHLVEDAGFDAVCITGFGVASTALCLPDLGLLTLTETAQAAKRIVDATTIPVIADADTGYGDAGNVARTIRELEAAGVSALFIEDRAMPRTLANEGKPLVSAEEMGLKIQAAIQARKSSDLLICARTDGRVFGDLKEAIARGQYYAEKGADLIFVEHPESMEELQEIRREISAPLLLNCCEGYKTPFLTVSEVEELGYDIVVYPISSLMYSTASIIEVLKTLRTTGTTASLLSRMVSEEQMCELVNWRDFERLHEPYQPDRSS